MQSPFDLNALAKLKAFANFNPQEVEKLTELCDRIQYPAEKKIFSEGAPSDHMYVILGGTVRVERGDDHKVILARLHAGDFFGDLSLFDGEPRSASVVTETPCDFMVIEQTTLGVLATTAPRAVIKLLVAIGKTLASRLRAGNQKYFDLVLGCHPKGESIS